MLRNDRKRIAPTTVVNRLSYSTQERELQRLSALVKVAREKLPRLAHAKSLQEQTKAVMALGDIDGVHIALLVAKVDVDGDGTIAPDEFSRFLEDAATLIGNVQSSILNTSIVAALLLTVVLPMLMSPFTPVDGDDMFGSVFADAAVFFASDLQAAERTKRNLYIVEMSLLSITCLLCLLSLGISVAFYNMVSSMPGPLATVSFLFKSLKTLAQLQNLWGLCITSLLWSMPFVAVHASAVAFFAALAVVVLFTCLSMSMSFAPVRAQYTMFHEEAAALLGLDDDSGAELLES